MNRVEHVLGSSLSRKVCSGKYAILVSAPSSRFNFVVSLSFICSLFVTKAPNKIDESRRENSTLVQQQVTGKMAPKYLSSMVE